MAMDYYSVLSRVIEVTKDDPAQLRKVIYELARWNLKNDIWAQQPPLSKFEIREHLTALETAIARVERDSAQEAEMQSQQESMHALEKVRAAIERDSSLTEEPVPEEAAPEEPLPEESVDVSAPRNEGVERSANAVVVVHERPREVEVSEIHLASSEPRLRTASDRVAGRAWLWVVIWPLVNLATVAVLGWVIYASVSNLADRFEGQKVQARPQAEQTASTQPIVERAADQARQQPGKFEERVSELRTAERAQLPTFPLPTSYGVFAVSNGQLIELEALPINVPDPRIQLSAEITKPPQTVLPDGNVTFVIYRRDLANNAPTKVVVRIVARVARSLTFTSGKASSSNVASVWRVRSDTFELKVAPLSQNREMILLRSSEPDFAFPAGRYAIVLGNRGYDFGIDGPVTDKRQCLERFQATTGPLFSECRNP